MFAQGGAIHIIAESSIALGLSEGFGWGVLGGALAELAAWFKLRQIVRTERPAYLRDPFYWVITLLMILAGGVLVAAYIKSGLGNISPLLAVNIGATAPLIIQTLTSSAPRIPIKVD
jgi:hypothetical protein